jgi:hypothetical protein
MGQRANVKFCFKTGKTTTETSQPMKQAYGDSVPSRTPTAVRTSDMIETARELISADHRMTLDAGRGARN